MTVLALRLLAAGCIVAATAVISGALGFWYGRDRARASAEAALHEAFREARFRDKEWFRPTPELTALVDELFPELRKVDAVVNLTGSAAE